MTLSLAPSSTILVTWEQYVSGTFNRASILWNQYRYSKDGVVAVPGEALRNVDLLTLSRMSYGVKFSA